MQSIEVDPGTPDSFPPEVCLASELGTNTIYEPGGWVLVIILVFPHINVSSIVSKKEN